MGNHIGDFEVFALNLRLSFSILILARHDSLSLRKGILIVVDHVYPVVHVLDVGLRYLLFNQEQFVLFQIHSHIPCNGLKIKLVSFEQLQACFKFHLLDELVGVGLNVVGRDKQVFRGLADFDYKVTLGEAHAFLKHAPSTRVWVQRICEVKVTHIVLVVGGAKVKICEFRILILKIVGVRWLLLLYFDVLSVLVVLINLKKLGCLEV